MILKGSLKETVVEKFIIDNCNNNKIVNGTEEYIQNYFYELYSVGLYSSKSGFSKSNYHAKCVVNFDFQHLQKINKFISKNGQ